MDSDIFGVFVIKRDDGLVLYQRILNMIPNGEKLDYYDPARYDIFSGFISVVSNIVTHVAGDYIKTMRLEGEDKIKIIIETRAKIAVAVVSSKNISDKKIVNLARSLVKQFNYFYGETIDNWNGDLSKFSIFNKVVENEVGIKNPDFTDFL
ncbi:MAG: hypothetical protein ACTSQY_11575 [Candidatus Odinarchaeia archaeon]